MTVRPEDLSDGHINQINRFLGLPQQDATELKRSRLSALDAEPFCA